MNVVEREREEWWYRIVSEGANVREIGEGGGQVNRNTGVRRMQSFVGSGISNPEGEDNICICRERYNLRQQLNVSGANSEIKQVNVYYLINIFSHQRLGGKGKHAVPLASIQE